MYRHAYLPGHFTVGWLFIGHCSSEIILLASGDDDIAAGDTSDESSSSAREQLLKLNSLPLQDRLPAKYVLVSEIMLEIDKKSSVVEKKVPKSILQAACASSREKVVEHVLCQVLPLHISTCPERPVVSL